MLTIEEVIKQLLPSNGDVPSFEIEINQLSSSLAYLGVAPKGKGTDIAMWTINRIFRQGDNIRVETTNKFSKKWDLRFSAFPTIILNNSHSTFLDGLNDFGDFGDVHNYEISQSFTYFGWVKAQNVTEQRCLVAKVSKDSNVDGVSLQHDNTGKLFIQVRSSIQKPGPHTFTDLVLTPGIWQSFALTHSGNSNFNGLNLYLDGVKSAVLPPFAAFTGSILTTDAFQIGKRGVAFEFAGHVNRFGVMNKELNQTEVTEWHNGGQPLDLTTFSASANVKSDWPLGTDDVYPTLADIKGSFSGSVENTTTEETTFIEGDVP